MRISGNLQIPWLEHQSKFYPDRTALTAEDTSLTFRELHRQASWIAGQLKKEGLSRGDYAGVLSQNSSDQFLLLHALLLLGAVIVPIHHKLTSSEIESALRQIEVKIILFSEQLPQKCEFHPMTLSIESLFEKTQKDDSIAVTQTSGQDLCSIFFTSGTTGDPKPVPLTRDNFFYSAMGSALNLGLEPCDNWLLCLPMDHMGGFSILMRSLIYGTSVTLLPSFSVESVLREMRGGQITHISLVPTMLARLLKHDFSVADSLRAILLGGAPAETGLVSEALQKGLPILRTYGLTEACSQVTTTPLGEFGSKLGSSGKPLAFTEIRIADEDGSSVPVGQTGEILLRGKTITPGYLGSQPENEDISTGDWFRTGDYGHLDEEGYLFTLARKNDVIITGGENVIPEEVESALLNESDLMDVCVFGVPDNEWGEKVVAAIVLGESGRDFNPDAILRDIQLARYKHPKEFIVVEHIPRTSLGKPKRTVLGEHYQNRA